MVIYAIHSLTPYISSHYMIVSRKPQTVLKGKDHPNYRHGNETLDARQKRREMSGELAELEAVGFAIGMLRGTRTRGRKAGSSGVK